MTTDWRHELAAPGIPTEIVAAVQAAIEMVLNSDCALLERGASERSLTHRLAVYLEQSLAGYLKQSSEDWKVDCEYNRRGGDPKAVAACDEGATEKQIKALSRFLQSFGGKDASNKAIRDWIDIEIREGRWEQLIYPDIVVHKRLGPVDQQGPHVNLLVIEPKVVGRKCPSAKREDWEHDFKKLSDLVSTDGRFRYRHGLFICFGTCKCSPEKWTVATKWFRND